MKTSAVIFAAIVAAVVIVVAMLVLDRPHRPVIVNEWWPRHWPGRHEGVWLGPGGTQRLLGPGGTQRLLGSSYRG
jgi:Flp pilus assembly protein protease CpaA